MIWTYAAVTAVAVSVMIAGMLFRGSPEPPIDSGADPYPLPKTTDSHGPSYEDTVRDQQHRWGHGHTLSDPSPESASAVTPSR